MAEKRSLAGATADLIPGLLDEVALQILARLPRGLHASVLRQVCKSWRAVFHPDAAVDRTRKEMGVSESWLFLVVSKSSLIRTLEATVANPAQIGSNPDCMLIIAYDPVLKEWYKLVQSSDEWAQVAARESGSSFQGSGRYVLVLKGMSFENDRTSHMELHIFDSLQKSWTCGPLLIKDKDPFISAVVDGSLYVAGIAVDGKGQYQPHAEVYSIKEGLSSSWKEIPPPSDVSSEGPDAIGVDNRFMFLDDLLARGPNGFGFEHGTRLESFDISKGKWDPPKQIAWTQRGPEEDDPQFWPDAPCSFAGLPGGQLFALQSSPAAVICALTKEGIWKDHTSVPSPVSFDWQDGEWEPALMTRLGQDLWVAGYRVERDNEGCRLGSRLVLWLLRQPVGPGGPIWEQFLAPAEPDPDLAGVVGFGVLEV